jgi:hypothetical protein
MDRALLLASTLAAFRVTDLNSPLAMRIFKSVPVWDASNTLALLNGRLAEVDGIAVAMVNKRSLPTFTGFWQLVPPQGAAGLRWGPCAQGLPDALTIPRFLRMYSAVALRGYTGADVPALRDRSVNRGGGGNGGEGGGAANAEEIARLRRQVSELQNLAHQQDQTIERLLDGGAGLSIGGGGGGEQAFVPKIKGSKYGLIDTRSGLAWGKCHLTLENVISCAGWCRGPVASVHSLLPMLCEGCEPGKNKEQKIRICSFSASLTHVDIPRSALLPAWQGKFDEFRSVLAQFGSSAVLCESFYTAQQFTSLYELAEREAERRLHRAMDLQEKNDKRTMVRCSSVKVVAAVDTIIKAALDKAFLWGKTFDPSDTRIPEVFEAFQSLAPTISEPKQAQRTKRQAEGERVGEGSETPSSTRRTPEELRARAAERRAGEVCFKFNSNEDPCGGKATCVKNRKHVCKKCGGPHAQSLTPTCQ